MRLGTREDRPGFPHEDPKYARKARTAPRKDQKEGSAGADADRLGGPGAPGPEDVELGEGLQTGR